MAGEMGFSYIYGYITLNKLVASLLKEQCENIKLKPMIL